ncbi:MULTISPECIES: sensor histidine kinase [Amycolatopsis]|uniref:sensor histidine kinase n=1 Tax=Amycolatopsis TaxID=1813 RepID=UPI000A987451|nr:MULTISPECIES: histidine kinase [Amycolatopsis]MCG3750666.1 sensor histidine kinase [Amycolatopsis sp. Poz14]
MIEIRPPWTRRTAWASSVVQDRLRRLNLITVMPPLVFVGLLLVVFASKTWWHVVIQVIGLLAAVVTAERWTAGDFLRVARPCLVLTAFVWLAGALSDKSAAFYGLTMVGSFLIPPLVRHRFAALVGLAVLTGAIGATNLLVYDDKVGGRLLAFVVAPALAAALSTVFMFASQKLYDLVVELEESREKEAELAVVRERVRFASELHDIQGHTLHVVKLKVALAEKLLHRDLGRAQEELREVHTLVGETIVQTKELAYAQRRLNLSAELENAKNLFEAAGIHVRVERLAEAGSGADELLGQVLRETTTNILRHAQARQVRITLTETGISIVNDGVPDREEPVLSGLSTLADRLADEGGELTVEQKDGRFVTAAAFPEKR